MVYFRASFKHNHKVQLILWDVYYFWCCHDKSAADRRGGIFLGDGGQVLPPVGGLKVVQAKMRGGSQEELLYTTVNFYCLFRDLKSEMWSRLDKQHNKHEDSVLLITNSIKSFSLNSSWTVQLHVCDLCRFLCFAAPEATVREWLTEEWALLPSAEIYLGVCLWLD